MKDGDRKSGNGSAVDSSLPGRLRSILGRKKGKKQQGGGIGVALGGGGAKGLAHIPLLELMDDMNIRPACIAGTSIGAVIGALYASGISGAGIRSLVDDTIIKKGDSPDEVLKNVKKIIRFMDVDFLGSGIFKGDSFMDYFYDAIETDSFDGLEMPLKVVATDFWKSEEVVLSSGDLMDAVKASMGLPGIFTPVEIDGRVLIDGGGVNPVPWDALDGCGTTVAVDVLGRSEKREDTSPKAARAVAEMFDIMQRTIVREKLDHSRPDIYIRPDIPGVGILEFHRAEEIYDFAAPAVEELRGELEKLDLP